GLLEKQRKPLALVLNPIVVKAGKQFAPVQSKRVGKLPLAACFSQGILEFGDIAWTECAWVERNIQTVRHQDASSLNSRWLELAAQGREGNAQTGTPGLGIVVGPEKVGQ